MDQQNITLISFGYIEKAVLDRVAEAVAQEVRMPVVVKEAHLDLSEFFDPGRRQYNGNKLLENINNMELPGAAKVMGLFNIDLFIPILTYIFGQAHLGGRAGIASLYRLDNELYGMPPDKQLLLERFKKEVIHELGHTLGLIHCHVPKCVMRASTYIEDIDLKEQQFCALCRSQIGHKPGK